MELLELELESSRHNSFFKAETMGVVIEIRIKYPGGPTRMTGADIISGLTVPRHHPPHPPIAIALALAPAALPPAARACRLPSPRPPFPRPSFSPPLLRPPLPLLPLHTVEYYSVLY